MKKVLASILSFLFAVSLAAADGGKNTSVIEGKIIDDSGMPAVGAKVILVESNREVYTDFDGAFKFESIVGDGQQKLKIDYLAHQELVLDVRSTNKSKLGTIELFLESR